jgi:hypothetical protein
MKRRIGQHRIGVVLFCAIAVVAFTGLTGVALAADASPASVEGTLTAGPLQIDSISSIDLGSFILTGRAGTLKSVGSSGTMVVTDARGSGAGWKIQVVRSAFISGSHTLDGLMTWMPPVPTKVDSDSSDLPSTFEGTKTISASTNTIAQAATDAGMGSYNLTFSAENLKMSITADDYAGRYTGTVTVSSVTGP